MHDVEKPSARSALAALWNAEISRFLEGERSPSPELEPWLASYSGKGSGAVDLEAFPEPFLGPLMGTPKVAFLALNPGVAYPMFQYRPSGTFVKELEKEPYLDWAARWRYLDEEKPRVEGGLKFHAARRRFMRDWFDDPLLDREDMLSFELYPWHSKMLSAYLRPAPGTIQKFVFDPIAESGVVVTFAFGSPWFRIAELLGLRQVLRLHHPSSGGPGSTYPTTVESRVVAVYETVAGRLLVLEKHLGGAGPPKSGETLILREELEKRGLA